MMEQEAETLLVEANPAPQPWVSRRLLGVVGVVGLVCTAAVLPRQWSSNKVVAPKEKMAFMQAQAFIPFAEAQAMSNTGAPAQPAMLPGVLPPAQPASGLPGPYGAQQGYGAGVAHGPAGAPIATHPDDFIAHRDAPAQNQPVPLPAPAGGGDKPVTLDIFYETKCPYSLQFIDGEVKPAMSDPTCVFQHVHINWEPYGNVQDTGGALICQHGTDECFGNKLHICAKKEFGGNDAGLNDWITCHMSYLTSETSHLAEDMAGYSGCPGADAQKLTDCAKDPAIFADLRKVGQETQAEHSEHMPWATTAIGQPNLQGRLVEGLCQMYGTGQLAAYPKPACCS